MVTVGTGSSGTRFIDTNYPNEEGLILGTTKLKDDYSLTPENGSNVSAKDKVGL